MAKRTKDTGGLPATLSDWEKRMAEEAQDVVARAASLGGGGNVISIKGGRLSLAGADLGTDIECVILDYSFDNAWYEQEFDENNPSSPSCWAVALRDDGLAPSDDVPSKQHETCKGCWANEFASDNKGRGKACGNKARLAIVSARPEELASIKAGKEANLFSLRLPPTGLKTWGLYVKKIGDVLRRPPYGVVSKISIVPKGGAFTTTVDLVDQIKDPALLGQLSLLRAKAIGSAAAPGPLLDVSGYKFTEATADKNGRRPAGAQRRQPVSRPVRQSSGAAKAGKPTGKPAGKKSRTTPAGGVRRSSGAGAGAGAGAAAPGAAKF